MKRKKFRPGDWVHVYQIAKGGFTLFYSVTDRLVFYTIFCTEARKHGIHVLALCLMFNHLHALYVYNDGRSLQDFIGAYTSKFSLAFNKDCGRSGPLIKGPFGAAGKQGSKKRRTAVAYLFNNHVEKGIGKKAEDCRWNFLAYAVNKRPFSTGDIKHASSRLLRAIREVKAFWAHLEPLGYATLRRMFATLDEKERQLLVDYIIEKYYMLDHRSLVRLYGSYENMVTAINSNTGSEYDMQEENDFLPDTNYVIMTRFITKEGYINQKMVVTLPVEEKQALRNKMHRLYGLPTKQIDRFLHLASG